MAVFVSATDESAGKSQQDTFFFGGWMAPEEDWSRLLTPEWDKRVLEGPPRIPHLHMTDIRSREWREKYGITRPDGDHRLDEAIAVIQATPSLIPVCIDVPAASVRDKFSEARVVAQNGTNRPFDPDYLCFLGYAYMALDHLENNYPEAEKLEFVIERNGPITDYIRAFHSELPKALAALGRPSLGALVGDLIPGDKDRIPLQAADVLCWHVARRESGLMDADDQRRFSAMVEHRKAARASFDEALISKIEKAVLRP